MPMILVQPAKFSVFSTTRVSMPMWCEVPPQWLGICTGPCQVSVSGAVLEASRCRSTCFGPGTGLPTRLWLTPLGRVPCTAATPLHPKDIRMSFLLQVMMKNCRCRFAAVGCAHRYQVGPRTELRPPGMSFTETRTTGPRASRGSPGLMTLWSRKVYVHLPGFKLVLN